MFCKGLVNMPKNIQTSTIVTSKWIQQGIINICYVHRPEILGDLLWEDDGIANSVPFRNLNGMRECENIYHMGPNGKYYLLGACTHKLLNVK